jgi:hypothetical protein
MFPRPLPGTSGAFLSILAANLDVAEMAKRLEMVLFLRAYVHLHLSCSSAHAQNSFAPPFHHHQAQSRARLVQLYVISGQVQNPALVVGFSMGQE